MNVLNVLLSWSGATSRSIASILRERLSASFPSVNVWMSETDVPAGANWSFTVAKALERTQFGVICVTAENMNAPWLMFEAGALSKALGNVQRLPMGIVSTNEEDDDVPGCLFAVLPGAYSVGFDFERALWENEVIIFARASQRRRTLVRVEP